MKALVTGASGFVGSHLVEFLVRKGYDVVGVYYSKPIDNNKIEQFQCDINSLTNIKKVIKDIKPDQIYNLAGIAYIPESFNNPIESINAILNSNLNVLESVRQESPETKILCIGSASEYGYFDETDLPLSEDSLLRPITPYAVGKVSASLSCYQYNKFYGLKVIRVRPFNHIGPRQSEKFVCSGLAKQIVMIEKGIIKPELFVGNIEVSRDFLDVRDVVNAYWLLLEKGELGEVYNICSGNLISIKSILDKLISLSTYQGSIKVIIDKEKLRQHDFLNIYGSFNKLQNITGWKPLYEIDETLNNILDYWRERVC